MFSRGVILAVLALWSSIVTGLLLSNRAVPVTPGDAKGETAVKLTQGVSDAGEAAAESGASSSAAVPASLTGLPFRSVTLQLQRPDWVEKYEQSIDEIAGIGADTVMFVVDARQEYGGSTKIFLDLRMTLGQPDLERLIRHAKGKGLKVILMPIVLLESPRKDTEWRGTIKPDAPTNAEGEDAWTQWWKSYTALMTHYSVIAKGTDVDLFVVGSELVSTQSQVDQWRKVIAHVRTIYKGKLTYSSNWDNYTAVKIWDELDVIGMNSYWDLSEGRQSKATVEDIKTAWRDIQYDLLPFAAKQAKPIIFLEAGWCSIANAAHEPWDYTQTREPIDLDLQRRLYQGFFESWYGHPQLGGFSMWAWSPEDGGPKDRGYSPKGKPAEGVLRTFLGRPAWTVTPSAAGTREGKRDGPKPNRGKNR